MNDKWEYQSVDIFGQSMRMIDERLNSLGQEGWEVISHNNDVKFEKHYFILKRNIS